MKLALRRGNAYAMKVYGEALSNIKRWRRRYDPAIGWKSLRDKSHKPLSPHPNQHTAGEEALIRKAFEKKFFRYGWIEVFNYLVDELGYTRSYWGMRDAARRMVLAAEEPKAAPPRKKSKRFPELKVPGEKVRIDVKEVPYNCLRGDLNPTLSSMQLKLEHYAEYACFCVNNMSEHLNLFSAEKAARSRVIQPRPSKQAQAGRLCTLPDCRGFFADTHRRRARACRRSGNGAVVGVRRQFFRFWRGRREESGQIGERVVDYHGRSPFVKFRREMKKTRNSRVRITGGGVPMKLWITHRADIRQ
ncbi:MAG: hypothetical protein FWC27_00260 [Firmicutes bacterium]|nr:hypothetical protein [Bacillota bacterium]